MADGRIIIDVTIDTNQLKKSLAAMKRQAANAGKAAGEGLETYINKGAKSAESGINGLQSSFLQLRNIISAAFLGKQLISFGKQAIELGSDIAEVQNVVDTAFGSMAYKIEQFSDNSIKKFGMSKLSAKQTASTYMAMARSMGIANTAASNMAINLTGLTGDIASFYNISQQEADTKLKSVFTGETEALKSLGVVMTQTNLDAYAMANGFGKTTDAMSQAELVALRYAYVTNQLSLAQGDFAKTSNSWANQTRILTETWNEFLSVVGQGLIQVLTPALQFLNFLVDRLLVFAHTLNAVFGGMSDSKQSETAKSVANIAASTNAAATAQNNLAKATKAAGKAANGSLASFDELNILQKKSAPAASSSTTGGSIDIPALDLPAEIGENVKISPKLKKTLEDLIDIFKRFSPALKGIGAAFAAAFGVSMLSKIIAKIITFSKKFNVLNDAIAMGSYLYKKTKKPLTALSGGFKQFGKSLKQMAAGLSPAKKALGTVGGMLATFVTAEQSFKGLYLGTKSWTDVLLNLIPVCAAVGVAISMMFPGHAVLAAVVTGITAVAGAIVGFYNAQEELQQQRLEEYFSGAAVEAEHLSGILGPMVEKLQATSDAAQEHKNKAKELSDEYLNTSTSLEMLYTTMETGAESVPGAVDSIYNSLMSLSDNVRTSTEEDTQYYYDVWSKVFANVGTLTSAEQQSILGNIIQLGEDKKTKIDEIEAEITRIHDEAKQRNVGKTVEYTAEELAKLKGFQNNLDALMAIERNQELQKSKYESSMLLEDIKSGRLKVTEDTYQELLDTIDTNEKESVRIAKDNYNESLRNADAYWEEAKIIYAEGSKELLEAEETYNQMKIASTENYGKSLKEISDTTNATRKVLISKLEEEAEKYNGVNEMIKEQLELVAENNRILFTSKDRYKDHSAEVEANRKKIAELNEKIKDSGLAVRDQWGIWRETDPKIRESVNGIVSVVNESIDKSVKKFESYGFDSAEGLIRGYESMYGEIEKSASEMSQRSLDATAKTLDSHSPSRKMQQYGEWAGEGFILGIQAKQNPIVGAFSTLFNKILDKESLFCSRFKDGINRLLSSMQVSMNGISVTPNGQITYRSMPPITIPKLAQGAVIPPNQQFMAVLGDQRNGRNLEAPESLIRQIVREESGGETAALLRQLIRVVESKNLSIGDDDVGKATRRWAMAELRRTGMSPMPG